MKIGILTYHRHDNYGAVLQCYALQKALLDMGMDVHVVDYLCKRDSCPYTAEAMRTRGVIACVKSMGGILLRLPRHKKFEEFRSEFRLSGIYTRASIHNAENIYDNFIVGSDNVWNAEITGFDTTYWLDFVKESSKCNSYAASMGSGEIPEDLKSQYQELLTRFRIITMREEEAANRISALIERDVRSVLDPTMLLDADEWGRLAKVSDINGPYILLYQMLPDKKFIHFAQLMARKRNMDLVIISFSRGTVILKNGRKEVVGPREWVGLIKNAAYVITDSFHGCAFSVLFHKKFAAKISQLGCRIKNLTDMFGLEDRIISEDYQVDLDTEIPYEKVDSILLKQRESSVNLLRQIVQTETGG